MSQQSTLYGQEPGYLDERQKGPGPWDQLVNADPPEHEAPGPGPFARKNADAFGVNQRSARRFQGSTTMVPGEGPVQILTEQRGRKGFVISVPASAAAGVYVDSMEANLAAATVSGYFIEKGSGLALDTEDSLYAVSATANTDTTISLAVLWG